MIKNKQTNLIENYFTEQQQQNQYEKINETIKKLTELWDSSNNSEKEFIAVSVDKFISNKW